MRARNIKPGFYKNVDLAECSVFARLLFPGLWMLADREGRLIDRPKQIKGEIFPYDAVDVEPLLDELHDHGFIVRYRTTRDVTIALPEDDEQPAKPGKRPKAVTWPSGSTFIQVREFGKHQSPHFKEAKSVLPGPGTPGSFTNPPGASLRLASTSSSVTPADSVSMARETETSPGQASVPPRANLGFVHGSTTLAREFEELNAKPGADLGRGSDGKPPEPQALTSLNALSMGHSKGVEPPLNPDSLIADSLIADSPSSADGPRANGKPPDLKPVVAAGSNVHRLRDDPVEEQAGAAPPAPPPPPPTAAGRVCKALKLAGIPATELSTAHPKLLALLEAGATDDEFVQAAKRSEGKRGRFAYTLGLVEALREEAKEMAGRLHNGPLPGSPEARQWYETADGVKAKGREVGIPYTAADGLLPWPNYRNRVIAAVEQQERAG